MNSHLEVEACARRDASEGEGEKKREPRTGPRWDAGGRGLRRLGDVLRLLGGPELFVLFAAEALVIVAFALEQLLEVRFAVKLTLKSREGAEAAGREGGKRTAEDAAEAGSEGDRKKRAWPT